MNDFDFDFEFDFGGGVNELDINAICKEMTRSERIVFDLAQGTRQLKYLLRDFDENKDYRFLSNGKGFSSINFIDWVCSSFGEIEQLYCSTLGVGKKHILHLSELPIKHAHFVVGNIFEESKIIQEYGYYSTFVDICKEKGWTFSSAKNHSKILLMRTKQKFFVLEGSGNLNENPKIEQFCFMCDKSLYLWYEKFFKALKQC